MKLRTKLILFVLGVVIVPVIVSGLIGYYIHLRREWVPSPQQMDRIIAEFKTISGTSEGEPDFSDVDIPAGLSVLVVDSQNRILYTNSDRFAAGGYFTFSSFDSGFFLVHSLPLADGNELKAVFHFLPRPENVKKQHPFFVRFLERSMWWFFALIVFSAVMITIIVRSFNRSIRTLESATRRVADGDLNFELTAKGNDEIASLSRSFDSMRKNLKESIARRSRFIMGVSHDLRTPLTSIKGYLEAISDGLAKDPGKLERYLSVIGEKSKALEERIEKLIEYVNMETREWRMKKQKLGLYGFLAEIAELYSEDASAFKRTFKSHLNIPDTLYITGDRDLLLHCFENLFDNAIRYTREGDTITLRAFLKGRGVLVTFEDSGQGISRDGLDRVFEPFYRGTGSRREQGSGLGLSIVKSIIDAHGWNIGVESDYGNNTVFSILISPVNL